MKVAVLKGGRSLERGVSLRSGARVEDALERLGHEVLGIDVGADLVMRLDGGEPDVAFVPGQAAYVEEGRGHNSMRLNFSGVDETEIREGIRRIGKVIGEQVELYGALTGEHRVPGRGEAAPDDGAEVLPFRKAGEGSG